MRRGYLEHVAERLTPETGIDTADYAAAAAGIVVTLHGSTASDDGDGGSDLLFNIENVIGSGHADVIYGSSLDNVITAGDGDDTVNSRQGNDTVYGGGGDDYIAGHDGDDTLYGGDGDDDLRGNAGTDTYYGEAGNDFLLGGQGDDIAFVSDLLFRRVDGGRAATATGSRW